MKVVANLSDISPAATRPRPVQQSAGRQAGRQAHDQTGTHTMSVGCEQGAARVRFHRTSLRFVRLICNKAGGRERRRGHLPGQASASDSACCHLQAAKSRDAGLSRQYIVCRALPAPARMPPSVSSINGNPINP